MSDEWIKTLADRRRVKFTNQELDEKAFLTAQVEGNKVVYSIVLNDAKNPLVVKKLKPISRVSFQSCRRDRIEPTPSQPSAPSPRIGHSHLCKTRFSTLSG